jgi:hypothetical protein
MLNTMLNINPSQILYYRIICSDQLQNEIKNPKRVSLATKSFSSFLCPPKISFFFTLLRVRVGPTTLGLALAEL